MLTLLSLLFLSVLGDKNYNFGYQELKYKKRKNPEYRMTGTASLEQCLVDSEQYRFRKDSSDNYKVNIVGELGKDYEWKCQGMNPSVWDEWYMQHDVKRYGHQCSFPYKLSPGGQEIYSPSNPNLVPKDIVLTDWHNDRTKVEGTFWWCPVELQNGGVIDTFYERKTWIYTTSCVFAKKADAGSVNFNDPFGNANEQPNIRDDAKCSQLAAIELPKMYELKFSCVTKEGAQCVFPFIYKGKTYDRPCDVPENDGSGKATRAWCATEVVESTQHMKASKWGHVVSCDVTVEKTAESSTQALELEQEIAASPTTFSVAPALAFGLGSLSVFLLFHCSALLTKKQSDHVSYAKLDDEI